MAVHYTITREPEPPCNMVVFNNMKTFRNISIGVFILGLAFATALWLTIPDDTQGSAPAGMKTIVSSSTVSVLVGTTSPVTLFSANIDCTSRAVTTSGASIMLTFSTSTDMIKANIPTPQYGHLQLASTTVVYDAGIYGCGTWRVYGYPYEVHTPSTTVYITEFKGFR